MDQDRLETCEEVKKAVLHAVEVLNGILTFDKIERGLMWLTITDVAVKPMVTECVSSFQREAERAGVRLALVIPTDDSAPIRENPSSRGLIEQIAVSAKRQLSARLPGRAAAAAAAGEAPGGLGPRRPSVAGMVGLGLRRPSVAGIMSRPSPRRSSNESMARLMAHPDTSQYLQARRPAYRPIYKHRRMPLHPLSSPCTPPHRC